MANEDAYDPMEDSNIMNDYFVRLGRFIQACGRIENHMSLELTRYVENVIWSDKPYLRETIRALVAEQDYAQIKNKLFLILGVTDADEIQITEVKRLFSQVDLLREFRNKLAHITAAPIPAAKRGWFGLSNTPKVKELSQGEIRWFHLSDLDNAASDAEVITLFISHTLTQILSKQTEPNQTLKEYGPWRFLQTSVIKTGEKHGTQLDRGNPPSTVPI